MASGGTALLPPVKNVTVFRNGDPFHTGRRFVVNQRQVATMEAFLNDVTQCIQAPLAVRTLYTPRQGHRVQELQDLQTGAQYVAAGFERFRKLDYLNTGLKKQPVARGEGPQVRIPQRLNVSAKWRKFIPLPCIIHVFRNGDLLRPALRIIIPRSLQQDLEQILRLVTEKASLRTGAVRRLCSLEGVTVSTAEELESGQYYIAVGTERFKKLPYVELLVPKAPERNYPGNRRLRRYESRKAVRGPEDRYSDSALLDSPESDGRRVKSTGDEVAPPQAIQRRSGKEGTSIFFARPVKVRKNRGQPRPPPQSGPTQPSVFKGGVRRRREEVQGAEEVQEDENTAIELPVDQRVAETVEDEEQHERYNPHSNNRQGTPPAAEGERLSGRQYHHPEEGLKTETPTDQRIHSPVNGPPVREQEAASSDLNPPQTEADTMEDKVIIESDYLNTDHSEQELGLERGRASPHSRASSSSSSSSSSSQGSQESRRVQGQPGGVQGQPGGVQGQPGGVQGQPGGVQGQPGGVQGDRTSLQSSKRQQESACDPPSSTRTEQSSSPDGPVAEGSGGLRKEQVPSAD